MSFGRFSRDELEIAEAALLAGLIQSPSYLSPDKHRDRALQRRNAVIDLMVADHAICGTGKAAKTTSSSVAGK
jgi:membrane peptidoglycan carboxypeptidase